MKKLLNMTQKNIIGLYARKAGIPPGIVIEWVEQGKVTISELSQGILGTKVL